MNRQTLTIALAALPILLQPSPLSARKLTLEECRQMAVEHDRVLNQSAIEVEMASCDRGIARANYFPRVSAKAAYLYNDTDINLIGDDMSELLRSGGTVIQGQLDNKIGELTRAIMSDPAAMKEFLASPMWQTVLGQLSHSDLSGAINHIGAQVDDALHLDIQDVYVATVSVIQPLFAGGKIIAANRIAVMAEQLAMDKYETQYRQIVADVDRSYWQIVAINAKKELAESYAALLGKMVHDAELLAEEGVATQSDLLGIKVKANEANSMLLKAENGLSLAKMLLCKQIGLPLDSDIVLADEGGEDVPVPESRVLKNMEDVWASRPEIRSLDTAAQIYDNKIKVARADMLPTVAVMANYMVSNPNLNNGFRNEFGGRCSAGVVVSIPVFHGYEAAYKTKKAKAEAQLYRSKLEDAREMISLEVTKCANELDEASEHLVMAKSGLENAEENLRTAMIGFEAGVVDANTTLAAQTAWLKAHTEYIESGIAVQIASVGLRKAQGDY